MVIWNGVAGTSITLYRAADVSIITNLVADTPIIPDRSTIPTGTPIILRRTAWLPMIANRGRATNRFGIKEATRKTQRDGS